jgi:hypothetical protein
MLRDDEIWKQTKAEFFTYKQKIVLKRKRKKKGFVIEEIEVWNFYTRRSLELLALFFFFLSLLKTPTRYQV